MKFAYVTARWVSTVALVALVGLALGTGPSAKAQTFTVVYSFAGYPTDGAGPGARFCLWMPLATSMAPLATKGKSTALNAQNRLRRVWNGV